MHANWLNTGQTKCGRININQKSRRHFGTVAHLSRENQGSIALDVISAVLNNFDHIVSVHSAT